MYSVHDKKHCYQIHVFASQLFIGPQRRKKEKYKRLAGKCIQK